MFNVCALKYNQFQYSGEMKDTVCSFNTSVFILLKLEEGYFIFLMNGAFFFLFSLLTCKLFYFEHDEISSSAFQRGVLLHHGYFKGQTQRSQGLKGRTCNLALTTKWQRSYSCIFQKGIFWEQLEKMKHTLELGAVRTLIKSQERCWV